MRRAVAWSAAAWLCLAQPKGHGGPGGHPPKPGGHPPKHGHHDDHDDPWEWDGECPDYCDLRAAELEETCNRKEHECSACPACEGKVVWCPDYCSDLLDVPSQELDAVCYEKEGCAYCPACKGRIDFDHMKIKKLHKGKGGEFEHDAPDRTMRTLGVVLGFGIAIGLAVGASLSSRARRWLFGGWRIQISRQEDMDDDKYDIVSFDNSRARRDPEKVEVSVHCEQVVMGKSESTAFVYEPRGGDRYVIIEVRGCPAGPPLLLSVDEKGDTCWEPPTNPHLHLASYLAQLRAVLERLPVGVTGRNIQTHVNNQPLVRYQAAVLEEDWRQLWDVLIKPFADQRTWYRRVHKVRRAPDIFFGVQPVFASSDEHTAGTLANASDWLQFWENHRDLPEERTFINFREEHPALASSKSAPHVGLSAAAVGKRRDSDGDDVDGDVEAATSVGPSSHSTGSSRDSPRAGIPLPTAEEWTEFWDLQDEHPPDAQGGFLAFAQQLDDVGFPRAPSGSPADQQQRLQHPPGLRRGQE